MKTEHNIHIKSSTNMSEIDSNSIELVITSPPYPMIEMWDDLFSSMNEKIERSLENGEGKKAFDLMHQELNKVWEEVVRVVKPGGVVCINIGDATRKLDSSFQLYPNHTKIIDFFQNNNFISLPEVLWWKPTTKATKFMGSGMLPTNAYVTLEHEHILIFRKGSKTRKFEPKSERRYKSSYFWEERNKWFSDIWKDLKGTLQELNRDELRERAAAFPLELPYRLINMYSLYEDTVLDPFWGTGTTSLAAIINGRNSVGYEIEEKFTEVFNDKVKNAKEMAEKVINERIENHIQFEQEREEDLKYQAENYDFRVTTKQERKILFYSINNIQKSNGNFIVEHEKFTNSGHGKTNSAQQSKLPL